MPEACLFAEALSVGYFLPRLSSKIRFLHPPRHPPFLNTISNNHNLHFSDWLRNEPIVSWRAWRTLQSQRQGHLPHPRCMRLRACNRDLRREAGHSIDRDTLAERSKAVAQGAIPKGRGFEPHRCHFCGMGCDHMCMYMCMMYLITEFQLYPMIFEAYQTH